MAARQPLRTRLAPHRQACENTLLASSLPRRKFSGYSDFRAEAKVIGDIV
jgi:hypothetical protein